MFLGNALTEVYSSFLADLIEQQIGLHTTYLDLQGTKQQSLVDQC